LHFTKMKIRVTYDTKNLTCTQKHGENRNFTKNEANEHEKNPLNSQVIRKDSPGLLLSVVGRIYGTVKPGVTDYDSDAVTGV